MVRNASLLEQFEQEWLERELAAMTYERALRIAEDLFKHVLALSPETVCPRQMTDEELKQSPKIQGLMRMRQAFDRLQPVEKDDNVQ